MSTALFWLALLALFAGATWLGTRVKLIPIVSQLLLASLGIPTLLLFWVEPHWQLSAAQLLAPTWLQALYGLSFALLLGHILSDVIDLELSPQSLKIALPSFALPFCCGLGCALWLLPEQSWLSSVAIGLLFSITAIPVLYLYLQNIDYPPAATKRLLHAAILMDVMCWSLFALAQGSSQPEQLLWPLLGALLPLLLHKLLRLRHGLFYSLPFFALMLLLQQLKLNALVFGIGYMLCLAWLKQPFQLPLPKTLWQWLQNGLAIPLILSCGLLQVDFDSAWQNYSWLYLGALLVLPVLSKLAGNWLGLSWADPTAGPRAKWRESLLLNIRGLTEIIFLNLLLQQHLIDAQVYFSLLLMSLFSTLLPALLGIRKSRAAQPAARSSYGAV
ncbi:sodium:proton antiporter [Pseudomonas cavernicola]|uniref:Sodium:proton antiporter n=1 Tax=Pseudomonas cavernicola TaxID=2320866 RepID=A0A418XL44_9PSED|nr:cation:proton antiporter [Pseudomonas cavernicola]RJG13156.1 sodium:proton antiporter [Pseudomonas cavernicola]